MFFPPKIQQQRRHTQYNPTKWGSREVGYTQSLTLPQVKWLFLIDAQLKRKCPNSSENEVTEVQEITDSNKTITSTKDESEKDKKIDNSII